MKKINLLILALSLTLVSTTAQQLAHQWVQYAGGKALDQAVDMALDDNNNLFVTGNFLDTIYFNTTKLSSKGSTDIFLAKYDKTGKLEWAKSFGGKSVEQVHALTLDNESNIYLCGKYKGTSQFAHKQLVTEAFSENFIAKLGKDGSVQWIKSIKGNTKGHKTLLAVDNEDNLYYAGTFYKTMKLENKTFSAQSSADIFVSKFNKKGEFIDAISIGGKGKQTLEAIICGAEKQLYLTGTFDNEITFEKETFTSNGKEDVFVACFTNLKQGWCKQVGGYYSDITNKLVVDNGQLLVGGSFTGEAQFGKTSLLSDGVLDAFVASYALNGELNWAQKFGGPANEYVNSLLTATDGSIYISGSYRGKIQKLKSELESEQFSKDVYLTKLSKDGDFLWSESFGGNKQDFAVGIVKDKENYFYQLGSYSRNLKIGKTKAMHQGQEDDLFINKFYDCSLSQKIDLGNNCTLCEGTILKAEGNFVSYLWSNGSADTSIVITTSGSYSVLVKDEYGCESSDTVEITIAELPAVDLGPDIMAGTDETITLKTEGEFISYLWSDASQETTLVLPPIKKDKTEQITLTVSNENGCTATDDILITRKVVFAQQDWTDINGNTSNYRLYPNPSSGKFAIYVNKAAMVKQIDVFSTTGNKVKTYETIASFPFSVDLTGQPKGTYLVIVSEVSGAYRYKVVVE